MTTLCFLWHMHQPFYKNLWTGEYKLPWTRLHALKDYAGMVRILEEFPRIRQTFNLVPSMVMQIEEYAFGKASDPFFDCAAMPAENFTEGQRSFALRYFFQANVGRMINRYPRYEELFHRHKRRQAFSDQDMRDLQVFSQLVWFDEDQLARDRELQDLVRKGRDFTLADQARLIAFERQALAEVLPVYRGFAQRGQIEISTTPFYHPILPLLCDSDIAGVSHPGLPLPTRFEYPQDAKLQLERARSYMTEKIGVAPVGLWPSEGSVSDQALALAADAGFQWSASDNGVLARTLGQVAGCEQTYRAYQWQQGGRQMNLLFRDRFLSDLIGFEYARMPAVDAARHFLDKIRENVCGRDCLVPIILDGENAWEWYEAQGRPFLRELYRLIDADSAMEAATISEALARYPAQPLDHVFPGSWINANFDVWIGAGEDNQAWELLLATRRIYDERAASVPEDARTLAFEELQIAEGSDWCWWYGPEHGSDNRPEFDGLFRDHLSNVYRALGLEPPDALSRTILENQSGELLERPENPVDVTVDGEITSPFEWMGAGRYRPDPRSGSMHGGEPPAREFFYGISNGNLYVRVDGASEGTWGIDFEDGPATVRSAAGKLIELETPRTGQRFRVTFAHHGLRPVTLPADGWIDLE